MTNEHTLLSFIARRYITAREDAATDALGFILNRSEVGQKSTHGHLARAGAQHIAGCQGRKPTLRR